MKRGVLRWSLVGVVLTFGLATLLFVRGPAFWQRVYYPLKYQAQIADSSGRHRISPYLIAAIINAESGFKPDIRSAAGAVGLMQVLPSTAKDLATRKIVDSERFPVARLSDPDVNIEYGTAYVRYLVGRYHEIQTALAAYNAGLRHTDEWARKGGDIRATIGFPETKNYVLRVTRGKERYQALYPDAFGH
jgi:soluble lytic murein transglycosylase